MKHSINQFAKLSLVALILTGCNSFNTTVEIKPALGSELVLETRPQPQLPEPAISKPGTGTVVQTREFKQCRQFKLPDLGVTPPLPIKELDTASATDPTALDAINHKHIRDLRAYIETVRVKLERAQREYLASCREVRLK